MDHSFIKCTMALSLVPLGMLDDAWMEVETEAPPPHHPAYEQLSLFKDYFISTPGRTLAPLAGLEICYFGMLP